MHVIWFYFDFMAVDDLKLPSVVKFQRLDILILIQIILILVILVILVSFAFIMNIV